MVNRLGLEPEVCEIVECIKQGKNFLLSGGAGSGKTYSLISLINYIKENNIRKSIACITYTNTAVKEIKERSNYEDIEVMTIHNFLWNEINKYQCELKEVITKLVKEKKIAKYMKGEEIDSFHIENDIIYKNYVKLSKGIISHDELLLVANKMYSEYPLLCKILIDKYDYIFIDEYQDTQKEVIEIFLNYLENIKNRNNIIGLFGDSMQSIYDDGIGDINSYIECNVVIEVKKLQNRRNPKSVIELANKIRFDNLEQSPSEDSKATNMKNGGIIEGDIKFIYSSEKINIEELKKEDIFKEWDFDNSENTKELRLTHNLISKQVGIEELMLLYDKDPIIKLREDIVKLIKKENSEYKEDENIMNMTFGEIVQEYDKYKVRGKNKGKTNYDIYIADNNFENSYNYVKEWSFSKVVKIYIDKEMLLSGKKENKDEEDLSMDTRDEIRKYIDRLFELIYAYDNGDHNRFIELTNYKINKLADKKHLFEIMNGLNLEDTTLEDVINKFNENGLLTTGDSFERFIKDNEYIYYRAKNIKFSVYKNLYEYLQGYTVLTTQHKVKGDEFDNVFIYLDNGNWNKYNFKNLFSYENINDNVYKRTRKLFYVCCTRAKKNLVVYYPNCNEDVLGKAKEWFGEKNIIKVE